MERERGLLAEADPQDETRGFPIAQCMECFSKYHRPADCPVYKKIIDANGGQ